MRIKPRTVQAGVAPHTFARSFSSHTATRIFFFKEFSQKIYKLSFLGYTTEQEGSFFLQLCGVCPIKLSKHDQHVKELCTKLTGYDTVLSHVTIRSQKKRPVAEADVLAYRGNVCDVFEVKCSHRIVKARQQLHKLKKHLSQRELEVGNLFFYCGDSGMIFHV